MSRRGTALPRALLARCGAMFEGLRPAGGFDETALLGLGQVQDWRRRQEVAWFANFPDRDHAPFPGQQIIPVVLGLHVLPLEVPAYYTGSLWRDDTWDRGP